MDSSKKMNSNENDLSNFTGRMLVSMRNYTDKKCRKGLLERGLRAGLLIGEFKKLENDFMVQRTPNIKGFNRKLGRRNWKHKIGSKEKVTQVNVRKMDFIRR